MFKRIGIGLAALGTAAAATGAYLRFIRPWMLTWGSTEEERTRPLPGDDLVPNPTHITTHAITIHASPREIWSWLVQMGQDRAGFYTHNWVERLLLSGIPDIHEIHSEWQDLRVGDLMRTNREIRAGYPLGWSVAIVDPDRALVVRSKSLPQGTYAFVLDPVDYQTTRLIARDRAVWSWWQYSFLLLAYEPLHAYMETGVLQGIKKRAEKGQGGGIASCQRHWIMLTLHRNDKSQGRRPTKGLPTSSPSGAADRQEPRGAQNHHMVSRNYGSETDI